MPTRTQDHIESEQGCGAVTRRVGGTQARSTGVGAGTVIVGWPGRRSGRCSLRSAR
jgi:hypothetical protein